VLVAEGDLEERAGVIVRGDDGAHPREAFHGDGRVTVHGGAVAELTPVVAAPARGDAVAEDSAGVEEPGGDGERAAADDCGRDLCIVGAGAGLAEAVATPALEGAVFEDGARVAVAAGEGGDLGGGGERDRLGV
jgi:hypothetical protein